MAKISQQKELQATAVDDAQTRAVTFGGRFRFLPAIAMGEVQAARVVIVQRRLTHYRESFFNLLRTRLGDAGVELELLVGTPNSSERSRRDEGRIPWAVTSPCRYAMDGRLCWQSLRPQLRANDFVVLTQENGLLANYGLLLRPAGLRVGLWGHGKNFQARGTLAESAAQQWKAAWSRRADWWFAYTDVSARTVASFGYPAARTTVINNAIDTAALAESVAVMRLRGRAELRARFGLAHKGPLGVFVGSLYADKRLDLLIDTAERVHAFRPDFQLAVAGDGPKSVWLQERTATLPWVRPLGVRNGDDKAALLAAGDLLLNPGAIGLSILDAFAAGLPVLTADCGLHGPEIAYLEHGSNGLMAPADAAGFAQATLSIIEDATLATHLARGSSQSAQRFSIEGMVAAFVAGVLAWQGSPRLGEVRA